MVKVISFEGCIGAGKTTLVNYFSEKLKINKILEEYSKNPFISDFYSNFDVNFETEITFLMLHFTQLQRNLNNIKDKFILADYSFEKDLIFAKMNLDKNELKLFLSIYNYYFQKINNVENIIIYIDLPFKILKERILKRARYYEISSNLKYFKKCFFETKDFFYKHSKNEVIFFNIEDLKIRSGNKKLKEIEKKLLDIIGY